MILRIFIPCSMIFVVRFKVFLYFSVPIVLIVQTLMLMQLEPIYKETLVSSENDKLQN